ncbi:threonyl-tRNA synthetase editing domain-containing protein [Acidianus ambivalens]|uniref:Ser-tRNA(Thr) hydrolase n=1 Tax=Acidianus ambivalens TaxID=2283 RepID=A0A650CT39_ACIAM|nr:threonyl-tRNA synthetase editing domain-containing protein [Acidianus ambivalens]MQL55444.1 Ser-tRNA(Thr) hydrolase [Acidianus ambivalens]QGR20979.1 Ser-tRNA(Thr) hydrolase [Acidianus ambivalens]
MIQLFIHASNFSYEVKEKAVEKAEEDYLPSLKKENALVVFTTVEKGDDEEIIRKAVENIKDIFSKVKASCVIIYPYAHLSNNLSSPDVAISSLKEIEKELKDSGIETYRAPFGWYKAFSISCYGHPLSELSRRITKSEEFSKSEELEICNKFGFPSSPKATFMKIATLEYLKKELSPSSIIISNDELKEKEGTMIIRYLKPSGRILPCINEDPKIEVIYFGEKQLDFPKEFKDSKNSLKIWESKDGKTTIWVGNLIYYILLQAKSMSTPYLPLWISPIHVRLLPVKKDFLEKTEEFANQLLSKGVRVEIDNKDDGLGNKIRRSGMDWIPYVAIVGEREIKTSTLTVRIRKKDEQKSLTIDELYTIIKDEDPLMLRQNTPVKMFD